MKNIFKNILVVPVLLMAIILAESQIFPAQTAEQPLSVTANFKKDEAITPETGIELVLNRPLQTTEKIAVTIGETDLTSLFAATENRLVYDAKILPLPVGNSTVTVYLIDASDVWKEIARFPVTVETQLSSVQIVTAESSPTKTEEQKSNNEEQKTKDDGQKTKDETKSEKKMFGFDKLDFLPSFTLAMKSQPFQSNFPIENRPAVRATSTDLTLTGSMKNEVKRGIFSSQSNFDFAGSSFKQEALRISRDVIGRNGDLGRSRKRKKEVKDCD